MEARGVASGVALGTVNGWLSKIDDAPERVVRVECFPILSYSIQKNQILPSPQKLLYTNSLKMADAKVQAAKNQITTGALKYVPSKTLSFLLMVSVPYSTIQPDWKKSSQYRFSSVSRSSNSEPKGNPILSVIVSFWVMLRTLFRACLPPVSLLAPRIEFFLTPLQKQTMWFMMVSLRRGLSSD